MPAAIECYPIQPTRDVRRAEQRHVAFVDSGRRRTAPAVQVADAAVSPIPGLRAAQHRGRADRPGQDSGNGAVADRESVGGGGSAETVGLRGGPAGGRGSGNAVRRAATGEHQDGDAAGICETARTGVRSGAAHLDAAGRFHRQPRLARRPGEAGRRGRNGGHDRFPAAVPRLRRLEADAAFPRRTAGGRRPGGAGRSASVPAVRRAAPRDRPRAHGHPRTKARNRCFWCGPPPSG